MVFLKPLFPKRLSAIPFFLFYYFPLSFLFFILSAYYLCRLYCFFPLAFLLAALYTEQFLFSHTRDFSLFKLFFAPLLFFSLVPLLMHMNNFFSLSCFFFCPVRPFLYSSILLFSYALRSNVFYSYISFPFAPFRFCFSIFIVFPLPYSSTPEHLLFSPTSFFFCPVRSSFCFLLSTLYSRTTLFPLYVQVFVLSSYACPSVPHSLCRTGSHPSTSLLLFYGF